MTNPEDIIFQEFRAAAADLATDGCMCKQCLSITARDAVKKLRLAGWIRSVDERNTALGID